MINAVNLLVNKLFLATLLCSTAPLFIEAQEIDNPDETAIFNPKIGYNDFKVSVYKGKKATLNLHSSHTARLYRTILRAYYKTTKVNLPGIIY